MNDTVEYKLISKHYGDRVTRRSQVLLMNHIDEGLVVLDRIGSTDDAKRAFCLHPLFQADEDLKENWHMASLVAPHVLLLTMEYRNIANAFLSDKMDDFGLQEVIDAYGIDGLSNDLVKLSPLSEVNDMLKADKVQNRKDFITYHKDTHDRSCELDDYFKIWLKALDITKETYDSLCLAIDEDKK